LGWILTHHETRRIKKSIGFGTGLFPMGTVVPARLTPANQRETEMAIEHQRGSWRRMPPPNNRTNMPDQVIPVAARMKAILESDPKLREIDPEVARCALLTLAYAVRRGMRTEAPIHTSRKPAGETR
jgi:hypothetical protein